MSQSKNTVRVTSFHANSTTARGRRGRKENKILTTSIQNQKIKIRNAFSKNAPLIISILLQLQIYKVDVDTRDILTWKETGVFVSEPVFVPKPCSKNEDEGVLCINLISATSQNVASLLILDATNLKELARISFSTEGSVAQAMHGIFVPDY